MKNKKAESLGNILFYLLILLAIGWFILNSSGTNYPIIKDNNSTPENITNLNTNGTNLTLNIYPNYDLTYGAILSTNLTEICTSGYSASVRDVPQSEREAVFAEYNIPYPQPRGSNELDHFYSLELGGSNDISNLFVQWSDKIVGEGKGFESKDKLENYLHRQMCAGNITQQQALDKIRNDWVTAYQECCA